MTPSLGALLHAFLVDELPLQKGFRPASTKAYRDGLRLFLTSWRQTGRVGSRS